MLHRISKKLDRCYICLTEPDRQSDNTHTKEQCQDERRSNLLELAERSNETISTKSIPQDNTQKDSKKKNGDNKQSTKTTTDNDIATDQNKGRADDGITTGIRIMYIPIGISQSQQDANKDTFNKNISSAIALNNHLDMNRQPTLIESNIFKQSTTLNEGEKNNSEEKQETNLDRYPPKSDNDVPSQKKTKRKRTNSKDQETKSKKKKEEISSSDDELNEPPNLIYQHVLKGKFTVARVPKEGNASFYEAIENARKGPLGLKKMIYLSWFESGNMIPDNCIVVVPVRTQHVGMTLDSVETKRGDDKACGDPKLGWVELKLDDDHDGELRFRLKLETTQSTKMIPRSSEKKYKIATLAFNIYNKTLKFKSERHTATFPPLVYAQQEEDEINITKIATITLRVKFKGRKVGDSDIYAYVEGTEYPIRPKQPIILPTQEQDMNNNNNNNTTGVQQVEETNKEQ